ncbi:unnamed protein product [Brassica oleracea]
MVHQFLYGLDDTHFHTIRSSLTYRVPLPSLKEVYYIVRQKEDVFKNRHIVEDKPEITAFAAQKRLRYKTEDRERQGLCRHCNRGGHSSDNCFVVIGYPEWWGDRPKGRSNQQINQRGRGRASSNNGGQYRGSTTYANAPHESANSVITERDRDAVTGLTDDQWSGVMKLVNAGKSVAQDNTKPSSSETLTGMTSCSSSWILDRGASHHTTGKLDLLTDLRSIAPVLVILADGNKKIALKEGTICLGGLCLKRRKVHSGDRPIAMEPRGEPSSPRRSPRCALAIRRWLQRRCKGAPWRPYVNRH